MTPEERKLALKVLYGFIRSAEFQLILEQVMHSEADSERFDHELIEEALHEFQHLAEDMVYGR